MELTQNCLCGHACRSSSGQAFLSIGSVSGCLPLRIVSMGRRVLRVFWCVVRWIAIALSKALTIVFAIVGAFAGGFAGALAGWASNHGVLRGAALVAIAGVSISLEVLNALRAYWHSNCCGSCRSPYMADFVQKLLQARFADDQFENFPPATQRTYHLQEYYSDMSYGEANAVSNEATLAGLSTDSIKKLPSHVLLDEIRVPEEAYCTICLQDIGVADIARSLPQCHHTFHLTCVDKWLIRHGSCPVCRQHV